MCGVGSVDTVCVSVCACVFYVLGGRSQDGGSIFTFEPWIQLHQGLDTSIEGHCLPFLYFCQEH